jgi:UDP-glucose 4-epimerase
MKHVIIFGATGGTGMHLTQYLSDRNYRVTGTGLKHRDAAYFGMKNVTYLNIDISKKEQFAELPSEDISCVILLAGMMPSRMEGYDPYKYIDVNITGTLNVLEFCREHQIKKIIFAQSHADVYGHWNTGKHIPADAPRQMNLKGDHAMYIISKCTAVDMLEHYNQEYGIQNIVLRLPTIYSYMPAAMLYVDGVIQDMACMYLIRRAANGQQIEIWGDPAQPKDIVYIKDFIRLVESAIESNTAQGIYNVGTGIGTTLEQQIRGIVEVFSTDTQKSEVVYCPEKRTQASYLYDISRTQQELGFTVQYPYLEMLQDMKLQMLEEVKAEQSA